MLLRYFGINANQYISVDMLFWMAWKEEERNYSFYEEMNWKGKVNERLIWGWLLLCNDDDLMERMEFPK